MTNSNPLIAKYEELYGKKKEEPKEEKFELPPEWDVRGLTTPSVATSNTGIRKANPSSLTSYDPYSTADSFLQVAELIKQKKGKIISMSMSVDATELFAKTISFEVMVADWDTP